MFAAMSAASPGAMPAIPPAAFSQGKLPDLRKCKYLGKTVPGQPCGSPIVVCDLFNDKTTRFYPCVDANRCCGTCESKVYSTAFVPKRSDPEVGVAIGSFRWPELVDLQCKVIRETCGPVPILISNDDPEAHEQLAEICSRHSDVDLDTNTERIGHTGGDLSVFHKGVKWGTKRGLEYVCKLSQRFIVNRSRWLHDSAKDLRASGLACASTRCLGKAPFDLRTEAVLLDVARWDRPGVLELIKPRRYWHDDPKGLSAETVILRVIKEELGGVFWPWFSLYGEDRFHRDFPDVLWHCNTPAVEYHALASEHGVKLTAKFHIDGWEGELAKGTYLYG